MGAPGQTHTQKYYSARKKKDLDICDNMVGQLRQTSTLWWLPGTEGREKWGDRGQRIQIFKYKR